MSLVGERIERYQLKSLIGEGGLGQVYLAEHIDIYQLVAIKIIRPEILSPLESAIARQTLRNFYTEAKAIAKLRHPHILTLYYFGETKVYGISLPYMTMEYREEGSLDKWVAKRTLPPQDVAHFLRQAADALQYSHDNKIIHQDVKPQNFLIRSNRKSYLPDILLADFGIAKFINPDTILINLDSLQSQSGHLRGTPAYMAPEQWNSKPVPATDQYALAVMTYELLTGRHPFRARTLPEMMQHHLYARPLPPSAINSTIHRLVDIIVLHALEKNSIDRYPSISEFAHAFEEAVQGRIDGGNGDIPVQLTISKSEAKRGIIRSVSLNDGRIVAVHVPPKAQNGQIIRLEGQGKASRYPGAMGALIVTIIIGPANPIEQFLDSSQAFLRSSWPPSRKSVPLLAALALLIVLGSVVPLYPIFHSALNNPNPTATPNAAATHASKTAQAKTATTIASANKTSTAIASANGTATAIAQANETATATAAASNYPYSAQQPTILLGPGGNSNFNPDSWEPPPPNSTCNFTGVTEDVGTLETKLFTACFARNTDYTNFTYEVQMKITKGDCGGIAFRADASEANFYMFVVCQDGSYVFYSVVNNMSKHITFNTSSYINKGTNQINTIAIVAQGSTFKLYVNPREHNFTPIDTISDVTRSQGGRVGLVVYPSGHPTDVLYMNAKVWQL